MSVVFYKGLMSLEANLLLGGMLSTTAHFGVLLPSQYYPAPRKQAPEQRLMIAVLHDAFDCVEKYRFATSNRDKQIFNDAKSWFLTQEADWPYSFESICGVLELDSSAVRRRLRVIGEPGEAT